ncbi:MAG: hypothetical protein EPO21_04700 [Chloroflexota bacterium]|nr:MAG: hypothetical protein EPO21_04700 [Chloroflexota bacterium]
MPLDLPSIDDNKDAHATPREQRSQLLWSGIGLLLLLFSLWFINGLLGRWKPYGLFTLVIAGTVPVMLALLGIVLVLLPLRQNSAVGTIIRAVMWPVGFLHLLIHVTAGLTAPVLTFWFVAAIPLGIWSALRQSGLAMQVSADGIGYVILVMASVAFTYWGDRLTSFTFWLSDSRRYPWVLPRLRCNFIRVYIYGMMVTAYLLANLEDFSQVALVPFDWWLGYKQVLLQVLVTYAAIERLIAAWQSTKDTKAR